MVQAKKAKRKLSKSLKEDLSQQYILLLLNSCNQSPINGKTRLMKELFFVARNIKPLWQVLSFEAHNYGPYSEKIAYDLEALSQLGLIYFKEHASGKGGKYFITEKGVGILKDLNLNYNEELVENMKNFFNGLSNDEVLAFTYSSCPEMTNESLIKEKLSNKRSKLALKLYKKKKISFGKAIEISGMDYKDFFDLLDKNNIQVELS